MSATEEPDPAITLMVVDDQAAIREALAAMLDLAADITVIATAGDGAESIEAAETHRPDLVLMDLHMPVMDGVEATRGIRQSCPQTAVLVLTTFDDDASVLGALHAGALGYLTKDADRATLLRAVRAAAAGQTVLTPEVQRRLLALASSAASSPTSTTSTTSTAGTTVPAASPTVSVGRSTGTTTDPAGTSTGIPGITARETEILALIGEGLRNTEIADTLGISEATVKTHTNNLFAKAGFRSRADAMRHVLTRHRT